MAPQTAPPPLYAPNLPAPDAAFMAQRRALEGKLMFLQYQHDELMRTGRPSYYKRRRALGFAAVGLGAAAVGAGVLVVLLAAAPHSDVRPSRAERIALIAAASGGAVALGVGAWALRSAKRNVHAPRIDQLRWEMEQMRMQLYQTPSYYGYRHGLRVSPSVVLAGGYAARVSMELPF